MLRTLAPRISDEVAQDIQTRILEGSFKPGDRLPPERQFAAELGVSRSSLREAIQKLVSRGFLASRQGGGTFVTERLDSDLMDPWLSALSGQPGAQEDVLDFREMMEVQAAVWAAERATAADHERLQLAFQHLDACYAQVNRPLQIEADVAFHQTMAEAAHNLLLGHLNANLLRLLHEHMRRNISALQVTADVAAELMHQHRAMLEAVIAGDAVAAAAAARRHIAYVRTRTQAAERVSLREARAQRRLAQI